MKALIIRTAHMSVVKGQACMIEIEYKATNMIEHASMAEYAMASNRFSENC